MARKGIYFDGFLPESKLPVRMERMVKLTGQMNQFYATAANGCATQHLTSGDDIEIDLFSPSQPDAKQLLPPSFLVPAVIEALKEDGRYQQLVHQVPGEADGYCAKRVSTQGGIVLTSDSDLLIHDLGDGKVVFLRDLQVPEGKQAMSCILYDPSNICSKLRLPSSSMQRLGYEVYRDRHTPVSEMVKNCSHTIADKQSYEEFCQNYLHDEGCPIPQMIDGMPMPIGTFDPRLSELALLLGNLRPSIDTSARMFLPVLVENPMRGSAWEPSTPVRQLAYTVLGWLIPGQTASVQEYRRVQAQQQKGRAVTLIQKSEAQLFIAELLSYMSSIKETTKGAVPFWLFLCFVLDIQQCERQGKRSHTLETVQQAGHSPFPGRGSRIPWDIVHFAYQAQASFYSLRMLQQVLSIMTDGLRDTILPDIALLQKQLEGFPLLEGFPSVHSIIHLLTSARGMDLIRKYLVDFVKTERDMPKEATPPSAKGNKKRKKVDKQSGMVQHKAPRHSSVNGSNMFSLLEDIEKDE